MTYETPNACLIAIQMRIIASHIRQNWDRIIARIMNRTAKELGTVRGTDIDLFAFLYVAAELEGLELKLLHLLIVYERHPGNLILRCASDIAIQRYHHFWTGYLADVGLSRDKNFGKGIRNDFCWTGVNACTQRCQEDEACVEKEMHSIWFETVVLIV